MDIGQQIHDLRNQKNLTQEELGERTDLSKGYISQLEHNQSSPSMETFFSILEVLGEKPASFFARDEQPTHIVYSIDEQTNYLDEDRGYAIQWLVPESNENEMEPVQITLQPGGSFKTFEPSPAETFILVNHGSICLTLGKQKYTAKAGETMYFQANKQHRISNASKGKSIFTLVTTASYL